MDMSTACNPPPPPTPTPNGAMLICIPAPPYAARGIVGAGVFGAPVPTLRIFAAWRCAGWVGLLL